MENGNTDTPKTPRERYDASSAMCRSLLSSPSKHTVKDTEKLAPTEPIISTRKPLFSTETDPDLQQQILDELTASRKSRERLEHKLELLEETSNSTNNKIAALELENQDLRRLIRQEKTARPQPEKTARPQSENCDLQNSGQCSPSPPHQHVMGNTSPGMALRRDLSRIQELNTTSNFREIDSSLINERRAVNSITSLYTYIQNKLSHIEEPWNNADISMAAKFSSVRSSISTEIFPHPTPNTVMRLALTSAYMNNAADIQADIEEAICAISTCTTPEDIQHLHARCRALHTIPRSLIHQLIAKSDYTLTSHAAA